MEANTETYPVLMYKFAFVDDPLCSDECDKYGPHVSILLETIFSLDYVEDADRVAARSVLSSHEEVWSCASKS